MLDRPQTYSLDPNNPNVALIRRLLRLSAVFEVIIGVVLFATGVLTPLASVGFLSAVVVTAIFIPAALRSLPGSVSIDPSGLTIAGQRHTNTVPWSDIDSIEVLNAASQAKPWLFEFLRISRDRDFVRVQLRPGSHRNRVSASQSGITTSQNHLTLYLQDPHQFADDANELRDEAG
jgi:hypothetical protein